MGPRVGVLALQGAFREHQHILASLGAEVREVRLPEDIRGLQALVMPGGESTTMGTLMENYGLAAPLREFAQEKPVLATCAGLIVLARCISGNRRSDQLNLGLLDVTAERNGFGRQVDSFEAQVQVLAPAPGAPYEFPGVFIRAPRITSVGEGATIMAVLEGEPVGVIQGRIMALTFHPELTADMRLHAFFLDLVTESGNRRSRHELSRTEV